MTETSSSIGGRIARYGAILTASGILCKILLLIYTVLARNILGQERFGRIEYFIEMGVIFTVLADFGLEQTVTREIARRRNDLQRMFYPLVTYRFAASLLGGAAMVLFLCVTARPGHTWALILCSLIYFFFVFHVMLIRAVARSFELLAYEGLANLLDKIVHIGLAMLCLFYWPRLPLLALCYAAGAVASLAVFWIVVWKRYGMERRSYTITDWIDWQKLAVPIGLSAACILLLHREDTAMVNWICGDDETGLYRFPYRFLEGLFLFPQVLAVSAYPIFSKLYHESRPFSESAATLMRGLLIISLPIAVGGTFIAEDLIQTLCSGIGPRGGAVFKILVWSLPFIYANFLLGTILNAADRQRFNFRASAWGLASNALLNLPAIYWWGAVGAAAMTVVSQGLYGAIMAYYARDFRLWTEGKRYAAIFAACIVMAIILQWAQWPWYAAIPLGAAVYFASLLVLRGVSQKDMQNLRRVVTK